MDRPKEADRALELAAAYVAQHSLDAGVVVACHRNEARRDGLERAVGQLPDEYRVGLEELVSAIPASMWPDPHWIIVYERTEPASRIGTILNVFDDGRVVLFGQAPLDDDEYGEA
jgi:hypothetical protein